MPGKCLFEVCVDSVESARNAESGGADRLELCSALSLGGLTPSIGLVQAVRRSVKLPVFVMVRPREGDFVYDDDELAVMERDIRSIKEQLDVDGFVFGVLHDDATVHREACARLLEAARPLPCTFHRYQIFMAFILYTSMNFKDFFLVCYSLRFKLFPSVSLLLG